MSERVLYLVACGAPPARDVGTLATMAIGAGWDVCVVATPPALKFFDAPEMAELTGHPVRSEYKHPDEPDVLPPPQAMVVAPATFNTVNKWAAGHSDTLALGLLNEAVGLGIPMAAVPTPNAALARHPAFPASIRTLRECGVRVIYDPDEHPLPVPYSDGPSSAALFPWSALVDVVRSW